MKLSNFRFDLPDNKIAKFPIENRDESKLMVLDRQTQSIEHKTFKEILNYVNEGDSLILNNTKVFPAHLHGNKEKTGAMIEIFLLRELNPELKYWDVLVEPARKIRVGNKLYFGNDDLVAEVIDNTTSRGRTIRFIFDGDNEKFISVVKKIGLTPIPRYLNRPAEAIDMERYQTIFAEVEGAIAPPTAGLHFSRELLIRMDIKGVNIGKMTLHLGMGSSREVEVEDLTKHKMDSENYIISPEIAKLVNNTMEKGKRVFAVGSSVLRALESSVSSTKTLNPSEGWTGKFIFPPYDFSNANAFITNFHAPRTTNLMLVAAFAGYDFMMKAYKEALEKDYRFLCYGDAMLIL
ncbi:MAG: tRNA preQ1(34) S-adenosylmethionine ribosyltransferase-isomerase QueA [Bacteroidetes bacterium]|nr:tRNA preQ1(34) S-adenosylmethionine ribosyltransferase-isomerase QueA [Bacteroidota bacterium]